ncbi:extracellular matrix regulator RemB [Bacillus chungangensis]|uniref:DUF370 domain-containing protein n=1 Tax=Bacillus chungangensis TaxID=587633 RepID=A0ABT9WSP4_9BACI|nr:extracellular matrix/biofilm biosynthesis regulator RemA family protein [Bacillus chungangensis]MDQ0176320.1 hypothetical protein [Bacillus chungangensis]
MYIHVGADRMIRTHDIIAILDSKTANESLSVRRYLESAASSVSNLSKGAYKSLVITNQHIFLSPLASNTLKKRSKKWSSQAST